MIEWKPMKWKKGQTALWAYRQPQTNRQTKYQNHSSDQTDQGLFLNYMLEYAMHILRLFAICKPIYG